jgi:hypothetical protein
LVSGTCFLVQRTRHNQSVRPQLHRPSPITDEAVTLWLAVKRDDATAAADEAARARGRVPSIELD